MLVPLSDASRRPPKRFCGCASKTSTRSGDENDGVHRFLLRRSEYPMRTPNGNSGAGGVFVSRVDFVYASRTSLSPMSNIDGGFQGCRDLSVTELHQRKLRSLLLRADAGLHSPVFIVGKQREIGRLTVAGARNLSCIPTLRCPPAKLDRLVGVELTKPSVLGRRFETRL